MIIRKNTNIEEINLIEKKREGIRTSVDNLDKRFKNNQVSLDSLKRIANNYAKEQDILNKELDRKHFK